jgi:hypothetical protein
MEIPNTIFHCSGTVLLNAEMQLLHFLKIFLLTNLTEADSIRPKNLAGPFKLNLTLKIDFMYYGPTTHGFGITATVSPHSVFCAWRDQMK